jgi:hypothetical protein
MEEVHLVDRSFDAANGPNLGGFLARMNDDGFERPNRMFP